MGPEIRKFDSGQINANQFADRARGREGISSSISHQKTFKKNQSLFSDWTEMALLQTIPFKGSLSSCDFGDVGVGLDFANCHHDVGRSLQKRQGDSGPKFIDLRDFDFDAVHA